MFVMVLLVSSTAVGSIEALVAFSAPEDRALLIVDGTNMTPQMFRPDESLRAVRADGGVRRCTNHDERPVSDAVSNLGTAVGG